MTPDLIIKKKDDQSLTIVVSKKISKKAVERNRIKRTIKEALRAKNKQKGLTIIVKENISGLKMQQVKEKLEKLL